MRALAREDRALAGECSGGCAGFFLVIRQSVRQTFRPSWVRRQRSSRGSRD
jgi:hypothetical protein